MNDAWLTDPLPPVAPLGPLSWARILGRGVPLGLTVLLGLALTLPIRLIERPLCGVRRPVTPYITMAVCRAALWLMGLSFTTRGTPMAGRGALVANHGSWLDIFALNARTRVYFVSKAEVATWPLIGWLARATGTLFIARDRRHASAQKAQFEDRLLAGHRLLFFPEGTSTDTIRVLDFKPTLFAAFFVPDLKDQIALQPVSVLYHPPAGADPRHYGWWGDMDFAEGLLRVLGTAPQGRIEVIYHPPLKVADFASRKALAAEAQRQIRGAVEDHLSRQTPV